jgi:quercetin 2,3-dioxygenase
MMEITFGVTGLLEEGTIFLTMEEMNRQALVANALPGQAVPYYMASGEGARYEINGQLVTVIARAVDTAGMFGAAYISGGVGAESQFVTHQLEHKTLYVFDGILHVWLPGESRILTPGDSVVIPRWARHRRPDSWSPRTASGTCWDQSA